MCLPSPLHPGSRLTEVTVSSSRTLNLTPKAVQQLYSIFRNQVLVGVSSIFTIQACPLFLVHDPCAQHTRAHPPGDAEYGSAGHSTRHWMVSITFRCSPGHRRFCPHRYIRILALQIGQQRYTTQASRPAIARILNQPHLGQFSLRSTPAPTSWF